MHHQRKLERCEQVRHVSSISHHRRAARSKEASLSSASPISLDLSLNLGADEERSNHSTPSSRGSRPPASGCFRDIFASLPNLSSWPVSDLRATIACRPA